MQSLVQLFNLALARLGGEQLPQHISPQDGNTTGAICRNLFPHVLDLALAAHPWSFALKRAALALLAQGGRPAREDFCLRYALPADCVCPVRLAGTGGLNRSPAYALEGDSLCTNEANAVLLYVFRMNEPRRWPPAFADALAWGLAGELASARLNDPQKQNWCYQNYKIVLAEAMARDRSSGNNRPLPQSPWVQARHGSAYLPERD